MATPFDADFRLRRRIRGVLNCFGCPIPSSRRTSGMQRQQPPLGDDEVGQAEQAEQLRLVLGQPLVASLLGFCRSKPVLIGRAETEDGMMMIEALRKVIKPMH